ncbi:MAG: TonB-dependent receptor [Chitinophagales bacterium]|nr:TonB-dependent receptor [Chitinophagales bacterium]
MKRTTITKLLIFVLLFITAQSFAQNYTVTGKVTDANNVELIGATVRLKSDASIGTNTDEEGEFNLKVPEISGALIFTYVGYADKEVAFSVGNMFLKVAMGADRELEEVIVVGYGVQRKSDVIGAISTIKGDKIEDQPVSNVASSIQGKVSGINVSNASGTPGASLLVSIRGLSNPLYVVEGIPLISESNSAIATSYDTQGNVTGSGQSISSISDINPDDIASVEILKDASSTAIYGARASNGVVLITTKRGQAGKTKFNLNYYTGVQSVLHPIHFLNSDQFVALEEEARQNDLNVYNNDNMAFGPDFNPAVLTNPLPDTWHTGVNTDWMNEIFRAAPINDVDFSMRGGSEKTKFFFGTSYFDQQGTVIESYYKRFNTRLNFDHEINDHISFGTNLSITYSRNRRSFNDDVYTGIVTNAIGASPLMPVYNEDGTYSDFTQYQASWLSDNPVKSAHEIIGYTNTYRLLGTVFGQIKFAKNFAFKSSWSADYTYLTDNQYFSPLTVDAENVGGKATDANFNQLIWLGENILTYDKKLGDHHVNLVGGFTLQESQSASQSISGQGFPEGSGLQLVSSAANITGGSSTATGWSLVSFLGRVTYDYKSKYLFEVSARSDGSSRFSPSNQFAFFPAVAGGWRISSEDFFPKNEVLTGLKLRASYGLTGDQEIGDFQYVKFWYPITYDGQPGLAPRNLSDPNLKWQTNKMIDFGFDYELFGARLSGSFDYYKGNKTDLLSEDVIPGTSGFGTITRNYGNIENKGWEFNVDATVLRSAVTWDIGANISYLHNEIISLSTDGVLVSAYNDLAPTHILQEGEALGTFWGVKYLGVDPETGDPLYEDLNNDGTIDDNDAQIIGKATPDYYGGFYTDLKWKNWDLSLSSSFSIGNDVYNLIRGEYESLGWSDQGWDENNVLYQVYANNSDIVNNRWQQPGDQTDIPRASLINLNVYQNSSQTIENGSFFRIRTILLGYTIKPKTTKNFNSIRIYAQVQNPFLFSGYSGFDPEVSSNGGDQPSTAGIDYAAYPSARTFMGGFSFNF